MSKRVFLQCAFSLLCLVGCKKEAPATDLPPPPLGAGDLADPFEMMANPKKLLRGARLTDEQLQKIRELRLPTLAKERQIEKEIDGLHMQFRQMVTGTDELDERAFMAVVDRTNQLEFNLDHIKCLNLAKIHALLTAEQRKRVEEGQKLEANYDAERKALGPTIAAEEK